MGTVSQWLWMEKNLKMDKGMVAQGMNVPMVPKCILQNSEDGEFYVMGILPQLKINVKKRTLDLNLNASIVFNAWRKSISYW